nr:hypothetical protein [Vampirovibrio sp.]
HTPEQIQSAGHQLEKTLPRFMLYDDWDRFNFETQDRFRHLRGTDYTMEPIKTLLHQFYTPAFEVEAAHPGQTGFILYRLAQDTLNE